MASGLDSQCCNCELVGAHRIVDRTHQYPERSNDDCTRTGQPDRKGNRCVSQESKRSKRPVAPYAGTGMANTAPP